MRTHQHWVIEFARCEDGPTAVRHGVAMSGSTNLPQVEVTLLARSQQVHRRKETRYQCAPATAAKVSMSKSHETRRAWVLNLSGSGIGLLLDAAIEPDSRLVIHLQSARTGAVFDLLARVVHSTPQKGGEWLVGCKLAEKLSQDDLDALL